MIVLLHVCLALAVMVKQVWTLKIMVVWGLIFDRFSMFMLWVWGLVWILFGYWQYVGRSWVFVVFDGFLNFCWGAMCLNRLEIGDWTGCFGFYDYGIVFLVMWGFGTVVVWVLVFWGFLSCVWCRVVCIRLWFAVCLCFRMCAWVWDVLWVLLWVLWSWTVGSGLSLYIFLFFTTPRTVLNWVCICRVVFDDSNEVSWLVQFCIFLSCYAELFCIFSFLS